MRSCAVPFSPYQTVTMAAGGTLGTIYVLTTGQPNLDYTFVPGGTCTTGTLYAVNATCTVNYNFTAKAPGQRLGASDGSKRSGLHFHDF